MKFFGYDINFNKTENISVNRPKQVDINRTINNQVQLYRSRQDISTWRSALTSAENILFPQRFNLYRIYKDVELDAHISAAIAQRKALTMCKEFEVKINDEEDEELTKLIKAKWFRDFVDLSLDSIFWGHSLIQFDSLVDNEFKCVDLVPREYVKPEFHIVTANYSDVTGTDYLENPYRNWCIGVGKDRDLGLYNKLVPLYLWKKNAIGAWAEFVEVFGVPIRIGKTNVRDEQTRSNMEGFLKGLGVSSYGVFDTDDLIEIVESGRSDAYNVFDMMIQRCNSEISKLILLQTGTLDEKSYVGSAEVQERVLKKLGYSDEYFIESVLNYQLVPMLNRLGLLPIGAKICVEAEEDLSLIEQSKIDIELIKTGKFTFEPEYLDEKYGSEVIPVVPVQDNNSIQNISNSLNDIYQ